MYDIHLPFNISVIQKAINTCYLFEIPLLRDYMRGWEIETNLRPKAEGGESAKHIYI